MLSDAISSEAYKFLQNRWTAFWSYGFAPVLTLVLSLGFIAVIMANVPAEMRAQPVDLSSQIKDVVFVRMPTYYVAMLFNLLGSALIFAGDYRWETWRLMAPRNSRTNLIVSKIILVTIAATLAMLALTVVTLLAAAIGALLNGAPMQWTLGSQDNFWIIMLSALGVASLQLIQGAAVVALAAVLTRSLIGAILVTVFLTIAQLALQGMIQGMPEAWHLMLLPGLSADVLRAHIGGVMVYQQQAISEDLARQALLGLMLWIVGPFAAAWGLFVRQDLSKE